MLEWVNPLLCRQIRNLQCSKNEGSHGLGGTVDSARRVEEGCGVYDPRASRVEEGCGVYDPRARLPDDVSNGTLAFLSCLRFSIEIRNNFAVWTRPLALECSVPR